MVILATDFQRLFEQSPLPMYIVQDGLFRLVNMKMEEFTGYRAGELLGTPVDELVHPGDRNMVRDYDRRRLSGDNVPENFVFRTVTRSGVKRVRGFFSPVQLEDGPAIQVLLAELAESGEIQGPFEPGVEEKLQRMENELELHKAYFEQLFENAPIGIAMLDNRDRVICANKGFQELFQYSSAEARGRDIKELIIPEELHGESLALMNTALKGEAVRKETVRRRKDGSLVFVALFSYPIEAENQDQAIYAIYIDVTERRQAEDLFRTMTDSSPIGIYIVQDGKFRFVNPQFMEHTGYSMEELMDLDALELVHPDDRETVRKKAVQMLKGGAATPYEFRVMNKWGDVKWVMETVTSIIYQGRRAALGSFMEITERKLAEERLKYLSLHDSLTGLYNRAYFEQEMRRAGRFKHTPVGIIVSDLDGLKFVNDTLGHDSGDSLLVAAARVFKQCFRDGDVVARIGGDEFAVLLPGCNRAVLDNACRRIKEAVCSYNDLNPGLPLSLSAGFSYSATGPHDMEMLFKKADNNMYREKLHRNKSARSAIVQTMIKAMEARDFISEGHAVRLQELVAEVAAALGLPEHRVSDLKLLAQFHDIGKVGIPDRILDKSGPLTEGEIIEMRRHCEIGHRIAQSSPDLAPIADWILKHHEWWDGNGYPLGLAGEDIPLECRILTIADAYDAMTSNRPYRNPLSHREAGAELLRCAGSQFDPQLVLIFLAVLEKLVPGRGTGN